MPGGTARRVIWATLAVVLLAVLVPPFVNVNRYRNRVAEAIGQALGREVTVSRIALKLLPRPGIVLSNFVVAENPSYGEEPMLRADSVTAFLRLTSLWRGRLEIGTLDLDSPSLNLVRRSDGHWNVEDLVERASHVASAPTTKIRPEARPRFPYVEASSGRINFKLGEVKKAFAFTDADFALWLESENQWGIRLKARPTRTDVDLHDTGILKLDGRFQRASRLPNTPLDLQITYSGGPLGQLTKLIYGRDRGWRGNVRSNASLTGTPSALEVTLDAQVDDFRRYDIALGEALPLLAHCTGTYSSPDDSLHALQCESPVGSGVLEVRGNAQGWAADAYDLSVSAERIPAERIVALARHAKKDLPADLTATGDFEGVFAVRKQPGDSPVWAGGGRTNLLALHSSVLKQDLQIGTIEVVVPKATASTGLQPKRPVSRKVVAPPANPGLRLLVKPFPIPLGATSPATASAVFDEDHYNVNFKGEAELARLLNIAKAFGVGTPGVGLAGAAQVDLDVAGTWVGFAPPISSGKLQLHTATAELQGIAEPLQISSAAATLANQEVNVTSFTAGFAKGPDISGSASFPVHCTAPETCTLHFDVRSDDASLARLNQLVNPSFFNQPWYHLLAIGQRHEDALLRLHATGHFASTRFEFGPAVANNVSAIVDLDAGNLSVHDLRADFLGARHNGTWTADFTVSPPTYSGTGTLTRASMGQLGALMHDNWAAGTVDVQYSLAMRGLDTASLRDSATGSADFTWNDGALRHVVLDGRGAPLAFSNFIGKVSLAGGMFTLVDCKLQAGGASYIVKGTASYDRSLAVRLERAGGRSYVISGPLDKPHVETVTVPPAEATLR
ncbi:MAG: AsmA family protein [Candidatus Korobacteraceae bacterium]